MKLSILDQSPISEGQTAVDALNATLKLAETGDRHGYTRFWIAEHHALDGLASSSPEVMIGYIGGHTRRIRLGSGAVLLPYYKPYKVAENFHVLSTLFRGRVDIGIGRAPGGPAEASEALSDGFLQQVFRMPELLDELIGYVDNRNEAVAAHPVPDVPPELWMLGTSRKSAESAAAKGLSYCFGQFMSDADGAEIINHYKENFSARKPGQKPETIMGVSVVCAETAERAEDIAASWLVWQVRQANGEKAGVPSIEDAKAYRLQSGDEEKMKEMKDRMIIGDPEAVVDRLEMLKRQADVDEFMMITITFYPEDKQNSYRLISEELNRR